MNIQATIKKALLTYAVYRNGQKVSSLEQLDKWHARKEARRLQDETEDPRAFFAVGGYRDDGGVAPLYLHLCHTEEKLGTKENPL